MPELTLAPEINNKPESGLENLAVKAAIKLIQKNQDVKIKRDNQNFQIQQLFEEGFEVTDPAGTRKLNSGMIQQAMWRTANKMKPLDFQIFGAGRPIANELLVTAGVSTVMNRGNYVTALRSKEGAFQKLLMWGDGFIVVGTKDDSKFPIYFSPISNSNVYVDSYATGVRSGGVGRAAKKMCVIFSMSWGDFVEMYPEMKDKAAPGKIPRDLSYYKELERNYFQTFKLDDLIEVAHYYDIANMNYTCFAGSACTVIDEYKDKDYPYVMKGEPYIPVLQYICIPATEGFYNHGIGDMLYKLAVMTRQLMNLAIGHVEENTFPLTLIGVPQGEAAKFFQKLALAQEMRVSGKKAVVAMEYDPSNPNSNKVGAESLITNNLINEWQIVFNQLDREVSRLGVHLDDIERGPNITASQILAEEESSNSFVKQIMEYNASESEFAVNLTMDFIEKFVRKTDETPLNLTVEIPVNEPGQPPVKARVDNVTLGMVSEELKKHYYFTKINARSGAIPSNVMQTAQINQVLPYTPPGSPAYTKLAVQLAKLHDQDLSAEDFGLPQQEGAGAPGTPGTPPASPDSQIPTGNLAGPMPNMVPTQTDMLRTSARSQRALPVF